LQPCDVAVACSDPLAECRVLAVHRQSAALERIPDLLPQISPDRRTACYESKHHRRNEIHGVLLGSPKAARSMPDCAHATIAREDRVEPAHRIELASARRAESRNAPGRGAIEHHDNRAAMIVVLATELEQAIDGRGRDAALLHSRLRVPGDDRSKRDRPAPCSRECALRIDARHVRLLKSTRLVASHTHHARRLAHCIIQQGMSNRWSSGGDWRMSITRPLI
jgi:hypothetical protein